MVLGLSLGESDVNRCIKPGQIVGARNKNMWLSLLVSHPKVLKMGQHIVQNKGMTPKREKMRHVKETEDAPE